jgi:acyl carrier protein
MAIFDRLMKEDVAQVAVMPFEAGQWAQTYPEAQRASLLAGLLQDPGAESTATVQSAEQQDDVRALLLAAEAGRARRILLENHIKEQVARVLGLAASRIDAQKPLRNMGIDSLMTLELRNRLEATLKLSLPATLVFNYPTVTALTGHLAEKMGVPLEADKAQAAQTAEKTDKADNLENLSRDEVEAMLADELNSLDELLKGN